MGQNNVHVVTFVKSRSVQLSTK